MPGNYARVKIWSSGEILTAADLNGEFNNEINNAIPASIDDYSTTVGQMQTQTDPYPSLSPSQATSLAGEFERIRYQLATIMGNTYWYEDPPIDLSTLSDPAARPSVALEFEGRYGGASSTTDVLAKFVNDGGIINAASLSTADVAAADFTSSDKKFGTYAYSLGAGNILAYPGWHGNPVKGTFSAWYRNLAAGDYIAYNPLLGMEVYLDGVSGRQTFKFTERTAATDSTKATDQVQGSATRSGVSSFANVTAKWRTNAEGGAATDLMQMEYNASDEGTQLAAQTININSGLGGVWFFGAKRNDPATWDHFYAASGLPTAHSSAWVSSGTPGATVSDGVLNLATTGAGSFTRTGATVLTGVNLAAMTWEIKWKVNSLGDFRTNPGFSSPDCVFIMRDDSLNRSVVLDLSNNSARVSFGSGGGNYVMAGEVYLNTHEWHVYRLTSSGSPNPTISLYIDGVFYSSFGNSTADADANDFIQVGKTGGTGNSNIDIEYIAFADEVAAPVAVSTQGQLDSLGVVPSVVSDNVIARLQTSSFSTVFGLPDHYGPTMPYSVYSDNRGAVISVSATTMTHLAGAAIFLAGDGVSQYDIDMQLSMLTNSTANGVMYAGIDVDSDLNGNSAGTTIFPESAGAQYADAATASTQGPMFINRKIVLSPGLHIVRADACVDVGASNVRHGTLLLNAAIVDRVRL